MSKKIVGVIAMGLFAIGCGRSTVPDADTGTDRQPAAKQSADGFEQASSSEFAVDDFLIGEPVRFKNLTIFPVASRIPKTEDRFITLDEGLKTGSVEVHELGAGNERFGTTINRPPTATENAQPSDSDESSLEFVEQGISNDVNTLVVINRSDKPLYLIPGEVIIGGSQDRTIGDEIVIAANSPPTKIPVFCVEHGRWGQKGIEETVAQINVARALSESVAINEDDLQNLDGVAKTADEGKFVASVGQLGKKARIAVQSEKDQSGVWEEVAATNAQSRLTPDSGAFTANYCDAETLERLAPYLESLKSPVAKSDRAVGVLVAINGKIESMDVFESTPLFLKVWPKLLKSYALDAANGADDEKAEQVICTQAAAVAFFKNALQANVASSDTDNGIGLVKRDGQHVLSFTSHVESESPSAMGGGMGGMGGGGMGGGGVHFSGFSK